MVTLDMKEVGGKFYLSRDEKIMGQESDMIYLDGDGGGTIYFAVTTPDHAANNAKYIADKIGTFLDSADGTTKDYHFIKNIGTRM